MDLIEWTIFLPGKQNMMDVFIFGSFLCSIRSLIFILMSHHYFVLKNYEQVEAVVKYDPTFVSLEEGYSLGGSLRAVSSGYL